MIVVVVVCGTGIVVMICDFVLGGFGLLVGFLLAGCVLRSGLGLTFVALWLGDLVCFGCGCSVGCLWLAAFVVCVASCLMRFWLIVLITSLEFSFVSVYCCFNCFFIALLV